MSDYDEIQNRLTLKLVYYGPALSGKTTNLMQLHDMFSPDNKGDLMVLETKNDRTLFFDMLPLGIITHTGLAIKIKLFTVPGQVAHDSTRKAVLSRADGVAFIADSQRDQGINNAESFENLASNAARVGLDFDTIPLVVQFNKRDLAHIVTEEEVMTRWGETPWPVYFATALQGQGVKQTFEGLLARVYERVDTQLGLADRHRLSKTEFINQLLGGMTGHG